MPIYEYRCDECDEKFELFVRSATQKAVPTCPKCGSNKARKNISLFGVGGTSANTQVSAASCAPSSL